MKLPKKGRRVEKMTVFILSCDGQYALRKRPDDGLLAGLWEFPHVPGKLDTTGALAAAEGMGLRPRDILKTVERKHIFTHIQWEMRGIYLEIAEPVGDFTWLTAREIRENTALPTAFRQFWEDEDHV